MAPALPNSAASEPTKPFTGGQQGTGRSLSWIAIAVSIASLGVALWQAGMQHREHGDEARRREWIRESNAFLLGRRTSVFEAISLAQACLADTDAVLDAQRSNPYFWSFDIGLIKAADPRTELVVAAELLNVTLAQASLASLDQSIEGQLIDGHGPRVLAAFRLGRLLGHYDNRAPFIVRRTVTEVTFVNCPELASDGFARSDWYRDVKRNLDALNISVRAPNEVEDFSMHCFRASFLLERVAAQLAAASEARGTRADHEIHFPELSHEYLVDRPSMPLPIGLPHKIWVGVAHLGTADDFSRLIQPPHGRGN